MNGVPQKNVGSVNLQSRLWYLQVMICPILLTTFCFLELVSV
jgi:hypothetical protein